MSYQATKRQPLRNPDGTTTYYPENKTGFQAGTDIWHALNIGRWVTMRPNGTIIDIKDPVSGKHYDLMGAEIAAPAPTTQPGGFIGPMPEADAIIDAMRQPDASSELQDISIPLEELIKSSGTITAPIYANDPIIKPENQPIIRVPTFDEKHPTVEQWLKDNPTDSAALELIDDLTGYKDMFSGTNENALMAWIAILPIGAMTELKGLMALGKAISAKTFIKMADKASMYKMLENALAEAIKTGDKELIAIIEKPKLWIDSARYITQAEMQTAADDIARAISKATVPAVEKTVIGIKGLSTAKALKAYFSKSPLVDKLNSNWKRIVAAGSLFTAYTGLVFWAQWTLKEATEAYTMTASKLPRETPEASVELLSKIQPMLDKKWITYIPFYQMIWALGQSAIATEESTAKMLESKQIEAAGTTEKDTAKNNIKFPESLEVTPFEVYDGDTAYFYYLNHRFGLRLLGVNTPESAKSAKPAHIENGKTVPAKDGSKAQIGSKQATQWLTAQILNKVLTVNIDPANQRDIYHRILGMIFIDGVNINLAMVRAGWAGVDFIGDNKYVDKDAFIQAQELAKAEGRGIWHQGKMPSLSEIKNYYTSGVYNEKQTRIALDNLLIIGSGQQDYLDLWNIDRAKKLKTSQPVKTMSNETTAAPAAEAPLTPEQKWQARYAELKLLVRGQQDNILSYYQVPYQPRKLNEDGIIRLIMDLEAKYPDVVANPDVKNTKAPGTNKATTPTAPTAPVPSTPGTVAPPAAEAQLPTRSWQVGDIPEKAQSIREQEIWNMTKDQQAYYLEQLGWTKPKTLPLEKVLVAELNRREMLRDFPTGGTTQAVKDTTVPVTTKTYTQLSTELSKVKQELTADNQKLKEITYKITKRAPNVKSSDALLKVHVDTQTEITTRINKNEAKKTELEAQIAEKKKTVTYVQKPVTPVTPTVTAPITPAPATPLPQVRTQGYQPRRSAPSIEPAAPESVQPPALMPLTPGSQPDVSLIGGSQAVQPPTSGGTKAPAQQYTPVAGMTYQQLKSEYTQRINSIADDEVRLKNLEATLARKTRSGGLTPYDKQALEQQIAELEARIEANKDRKADLQEEINIKSKPVSSSSTPAAPVPPAATPPVPPPTPTAPMATDAENRIRKILGATTYSYDPAHVFTDDWKITKWTDAGYQVTVDANGKIIDIWHPDTKRVIDESGNLLGTRDGYYGQDGITAVTPKVTPTQSSTPTPTVAPVTPAKPLPPVIDNYTTYTPDEAESFDATSYIGSLLRHGFHVTLDAQGNIIDVWSPATNTVFDKDMNAVGERSIGYGQG